MPLYEALNSVKVIATTNQEPVSFSFEEGVNGVRILKKNNTNEVIAATTLLDGHIAKLEHNEDDESSEEKLRFSIDSHPPLRLQNLGGGRGGIGLCVSGVPILFPYGRGKTACWVEKDDSVSFVFEVDEGVQIGGKLIGLHEESKLKFMNGERHCDYFTDFLAVPVPIPFMDDRQEELEDMEFVPTWVDLRYNPGLKRRVSLLKKVADVIESKAASSCCTGADLRFLVAEALGEDVRKELLQENYWLQRRLEALDGLRAYALRVEIVHSAGTLVCAWMMVMRYPVHQEKKYGQSKFQNTKAM